MSLDKGKVSVAVGALYKVVQQEGKKSLLDEVDPVLVQMCLKNIPKKKVYLKLSLPNGLQHENTDVCVFVSDLDKGKDRDYEPTVRHYQDLFSQHNVTVSEIIPLKSLKTEYKPYEAKRNLSNAYDVFLADACVTRLLPTYLGKHFYGKNKCPISVNLKAKKLKEEIDSAVNSGSCTISNTGSSSTAVVGHTEMSESSIVDNLLSAVDQLARSVPGGWPNVKQLSIKTALSVSIPVYLSQGGPQEVEMPAEEARQEEPEAEEISTLFGAKVKVYPNGYIRIIDDEGNKERRRFQGKKRIFRNKRGKQGGIKAKPKAKAVTKAKPEKTAPEAKTESKPKKKSEAKTESKLKKKSDAKAEKKTKKTLKKVKTPEVPTKRRKLS